MAYLETVAGAFLSGFFDYLFNKMESPEVIHFFKGNRALDEGLLTKLKITMITVSGLLDHAEEKQISLPAVKKWLDELKHAAFQADDLLDEIGYEDLRSKLEAGSTKHKVHQFLSSRNPFEKAVNEKLQEIHDLIEHLLKQMQALRLTLREGIGSQPSMDKTPSTSSPDDEFGVYGRQVDFEAIVKCLLSDHGNGVGVICIVGIGGMGKTTLARLIYNDVKVMDLFNPKAWVYVSEEFNISKITNDVLSEIMTSKNFNAENLERLQSELKKQVEGKKFLLILDDVWSDSHVEWEILLKPLKFGAQGSKIIVTTRNEALASAMPKEMHIDLIHQLDKLDDMNCWLLLARYAFDGENPSSYPLLENAGKEIANKCGGLPLAAKSTGSLLRSERNSAEWERISKSNLWDLVGDSILPALKLSYHYLPSHLKQCIAYCAILPKGFAFTKELLIHLWMAEGFLVQLKGNKGVEDVGNKCFDYLVSRSFFQKSYSDKFIMHDLIHDLSKSVCGEFGFMLMNDYSSKIPAKARYLSTDITDFSHHTVERFNEDQLLRTFLFVGFKSSRVTDKLLHDLLKKLKRLRVLCLGYKGDMIDLLSGRKGMMLSKLPSSIGRLIHLRYLNLGRTDIERLPDSICSLYYLEILILWCCKNLVELPTNTKRLINLCHLDIRGTSLRKMPPQMDKLTKLQNLTNFILGERSGSSIKELGKLQLHGGLIVENLQNVVKTEDATEANLKGKHLKDLVLVWTGESQDSESEHARVVLEQLSPHEELECLAIVGYGGKGFPNWLSNYRVDTNISFSLVPVIPPLMKLVRMELSECRLCTSLPPLGQLAFLKSLLITESDKVESIGSEFYGRNPCQKPFPSLQFLSFQNMSTWHEWKSETGAFPCLEELCIKNCPNLKKSLPGDLPFLTKLDIFRCQQLVLTLPKVSITCEMFLFDESRELKLVKSSSGQLLRVSKSVDFLLEVLQLMNGASLALEEIEFSSSTSLICFPIESIPKIKRLRIKECPNFSSFTAGRDFICTLQHIHIIDCRKMRLASILKFQTIETVRFEVTKICELADIQFVKLPSGFWCLQINFMWNPLDLEQHMKGVDVSFIEEIEIRKGIYCLPQLGCFSKLKSIKIVGFSDCESFTLMSHGDFSSLNFLAIIFSNESEIFQKGGLPAKNLTSLGLWNCLKLKSLPQYMDHLFPSLLNLEMVQCPELEMFPTTGLPSKLQYLYLRDCNKLPLHIRFITGKVKNDAECSLEKTLLPSSLINLRIGNLQNLISLDFGVLEHLIVLQIWECPKLQFMPESMHDLLPSLEFMSIHNCPELMSFPKDGFSSTFKSLEIQQCQKIAVEVMQCELRKLPYFSELTVAGCQHVESLPEETLLPSTLTYLRLLDFQKLRTLELEGLKLLTQLTIGNCPNLNYIPECMQAFLPSLIHLTIYACPQLQSFLKEGLPSNLQGLYVWHCNKLVAGLMQYELQNLPSLSKLTIGGFDLVEFLPEETLLPSTLTHLELWRLGNLKSIGLQHLTSLKNLRITECPQFQGLTEEKLPLSLHSLSIYGCPLLKKEEEQHKISHISQVEWP